jgi:hypothetical protein
MNTSLRDHGRSCFVIIPFGNKGVGTTTIDFGYLYDGVFRKEVKIRPSLWVNKGIGLSGFSDLASVTFEKKL